MYTCFAAGLLGTPPGAGGMYQGGRGGVGGGGASGVPSLLDMNHGPSTYTDPTRMYCKTDRVCSYSVLLLSLSRSHTMYFCFDYVLIQCTTIAIMCSYSIFLWQSRALVHYGSVR